MEQACQQQTRWARADDTNLGSHNVFQSNHGDTGARRSL
jgi:hypothetical protein